MFHYIRPHRRLVVIAVISLGVYLIHNSYSGFNINRTLLNVNISRQTDSSIKCFKNLSGSLPDLSTIRPDWKRSIYFLEVSCRSSSFGRITILPRQACAIESAAFNHPDSNVYVLYASRGAIENKGSLSDYLIEILATYKNIKFLHFDIESVVRGSIVESLYKENKVQTAAYPMIVISDILRFLLLHKYGGLYLDLDVMVIKNLDDLPSNYVGIQDENNVNGAVIRADDSNIGKSFTKLCLEEIQKNFAATRWDSTGPLVITKIMQKMCGVENVLSMSKSNCSGLTVFPRDSFYPISWRDGKKYFEPQKSENVLNHILSNTFVIHVWNIVSSSVSASGAPNSIYNTLAKKFCPRVYKDTGKYF